MKVTEPWTPEIEDAAANWLVRRQAGFAPGEADAWQRWLAADSRHAAAWTDLESAWATVNLPQEGGIAQVALDRLAARENARTRRRMVMGFAALGLAAAAAVVFAFLPMRTLAPTVPTVAVRPDMRTLPDGSIVELGAGAEIEINYTAELRRVRLFKGQALFAVAKNPARPFVVAAGSVEVRAVGTAFVVNHAEAEVDVLVTEGRVAVDRVGADSTVVKPDPTYLNAGGKVSIALDSLPTATVAVSPLSAEEMNAALAWRGKRIEFTQTPLAEAVELFNRQNRQQLAVADPATGEFLISGIFWADDPESFVRLMESGFSLRAEVHDGVIRLRR